MKSPTKMAGLGVGLLLATSCAVGGHGSPPAGSSPASPAPNASVSVLDACGSTPITNGTLPPWLERAAGSNETLLRLPHVVATPATAGAFVFGYPLRAGNPQSPANKILWVVKDRSGATTLDLTGHPVGSSTPMVNVSVPFLASGDLPSIIDVPSPGCWHLDLSWGSSRAAVELPYH